MDVDAFVLRHDLQGYQFATQFLASTDFDVATLKQISRDLGMSPSGRKNELSDQIARAAAEQSSARAAVISRMIGRKKGWASIRAGRVTEFPSLADPQGLVIGRGDERWYGPIVCPVDTEAQWYIRPVFVGHWDMPEHDASPPNECQIRWLCFARMQADVISLHWRGFSFAETARAAMNRAAQFPYWQYVPNLFEEIVKLTDSDVKDIKLHWLVLYCLWDKYRHNPSYLWTDRRIRAESSGVSLNAHAGAVHEIDVGGILHLARTVRSSIQQELQTKHGQGMPDPCTFDEVIMRTLIREFGTLSYEFSLEEGQSVVFRAHSYFGLRPQSNSRDRFPHLKLHTSRRHHLDQMGFLLNHLRESGDGNEDSELGTLRLFQ